MLPHHDHYIHELNLDTILNILEKGAWKVTNQTITSAITNDNDLKEIEAEWMAMGENTSGINAFSDIKFDRKVKKVLDVGGGKFDCSRDYMKRKRNIELLVWDPYNRSPSHNDRIQDDINDHKVDAATSMSVLNVIPEASVRLTHILTLKAALVTGGKAYFKIWPGEQPFQGTYLPTATDTYYQANAYADRFLREIEIVFGIGNVRLDDSVPNLIIAIKTSESHTSRQDVAYLLEKSKAEVAVLARIREKSANDLFSRINSLKLFAVNFSFFKKMKDEFIEQNRHFDSKWQYEYDKKYGMVLYKR